MSNPVLEIDDLSYSYRDSWQVSKRQAITSISLALPEGYALGFIGHNGAGKTTTIKCILDLIKPTKGKIRIFGKPNSSLAERKLVGYLPENAYFYDHLTVREVVTFYAHLSGMPSGQVEESVKKALYTAKIDGRAKSPLRSLSKGLTQRVALAQSIVANPKLLILDEPFSGLDPIGRKEFRNIFEELKTSGTSLFVCSHILNDVEHLCDRVAIISHGCLRGVFDIKNDQKLFKGSYELRLAVSGKIETSHYQDQLSAERALQTALTQGQRIESFEYVRPSLEEVFIKLVKSEEGL